MLILYVSSWNGSFIFYFSCCHVRTLMYHSHGVGFYSYHRQILAAVQYSLYSLAFSLPFNLFWWFPLCLSLLLSFVGLFTLFSPFRPSFRCPLIFSPFRPSSSSPLSNHPPHVRPSSLYSTPFPIASFLSSIPLSFSHICARFLPAHRLSHAHAA